MEMYCMKAHAGKCVKAKQRLLSTVIKGNPGLGHETKTESIT